jgi:hypothetical protein
LPSTRCLRYDCPLQFDPVSDGAQSSPVSELSSTKYRPLLEVFNPTFASCRNSSSINTFEPPHEPSDPAGLSRVRVQYLPLDFYCHYRLAASASRTPPRNSFREWCTYRKRRDLQRGAASLRHLLQCFIALALAFKCALIFKNVHLGCAEEAWDPASKSTSESQAAIWTLIFTQPLLCKCISPQRPCAFTQGSASAYAVLPILHRALSPNTSQATQDISCTLYRRKS